MISGEEFVARFPALARALAALGHHVAIDRGIGRQPAAQVDPDTGAPEDDPA